jgi:hypothetical protein
LKTNRKHPELLCRTVSIQVIFYALAALSLRLEPQYTQNRKLEDPHGTETSKEIVNIMKMKLVKAFHTDFKICGFIHYSEKCHLDFGKTYVLL